MSLIVYNKNLQNDMSIIFHDPNTRSLVLYNKATGKISLASNLALSQNPIRRQRIKSSYPRDVDRCPHCGNVIHSQSNFVHENYFQLLQDIPRVKTSQDDVKKDSFLPMNIFAQGYYSTFFNELEVLGNGARGAVYKVEHILVDNNLGVYALKKIPIGNDMMWLNKCIQEVKFMNSITQDCFHLVKYNHVWLEKSSPIGHIATREGKNKNKEEGGVVPYMYILQQFCPGGNLETVTNERIFRNITGRETSEERKRMFKMKRTKSIIKRKGLNSVQILSIGSDLAHGLEELHSLDIIHRDLKPSNCLLLDVYNPQDTSSFPKVLIGDFGESQLRGQLRSATGATGTIEFTAPEVIIFEKVVNGLETINNSNAPQFTFESDMYSLGMILYYVVFGELPFESGLNLHVLKNKITEYACDPKLLRNRHEQLNLVPIDPRIFELITKLLAPTALNRPSATETISIIEGILSTLETETDQNKAKDGSNKRKLTIKIVQIAVQVIISLVYTKLHSFSHWNTINLILLGASFNSSDNLRPYIIAATLLLYLL
ncbi:HBR382Wp [Eremothecium sinecaudum]|uniref:HBR382Wp n=1 Tax=Eremothecium sinecaudum TaxID=45286 RepID=A0A109UXI8_9SACH|nr:HBR382Wp [Eremothecium sinecaudum]AMD19283.1 HBR382Wp [Eremothecium sinecaudum]